MVERLMLLAEGPRFNPWQHLQMGLEKDLPLHGTQEKSCRSVLDNAEQSRPRNRLRWGQRPKFIISTGGKSGEPAKGFDVG